MFRRVVVIAVAAIAVWILTHSAQIQHFRPMDELLGKRLVTTTGASSAGSTADTVVFHVDAAGKIAKAPVVVIPKPSKFAGQKGTDVVATLQAKYGRDNVMAHRQGSEIAAALASKIAVITNESGTAVDVRMPPQWRETNDLDEHRALPEFVGKKLAVVRGSQQVAGHDPERVRIHLSPAGVIDAIPKLG